MKRHLTAAEARRCLDHIPPTPEAFGQALRLRHPDAWVPRQLIEVLIAERTRPAVSPPQHPEPTVPQARITLPGTTRVQVSAHVRASWQPEAPVKVTEPPASSSSWSSREAPRKTQTAPSLLRAYEEGQRSGNPWSSWRTDAPKEAPQGNPAPAPTTTPPPHTREATPRTPDPEDSARPPEQTVSLTQAPLERTERRATELTLH